MDPSFEALSEELKKENIRLSYQRIKVLEYLVKKRCHPTVEHIYNDLLPEVPTLSKTTVYNTLNSLVLAKLVRVITIEENEMRYDIITENHGHFKCIKCGAIYDFNIDIDAYPAEALDGFLVNEKDVYFKGTCPNCLLK